MLCGASNIRILTNTSFRYMECLKNHAASTGGHAVDGCREFMAAGEGSLKCAACSCHRNFHRKETCAIHHNHHQPRPPPLPTMQHHHYNSNNHHCGRSTPAEPLTGAPVESSSAEDGKSLVSSEQSGGSKEKKKKRRRRLRTKFTKEQRDGMHEFAERIGWKMRKEDEEEVQKFCRGVGLKRDVFKVWIHNTKQAKKRKRQL
ncbi:unnamed protein product [Cuscuta campestris]|uniref:ZF-HD dimerization-type domain-containing protein n=1 Tax=Cuscuta campestris TaxID=132261 RepID=A0A484M9S7_9ASTE|nr:unnamed protein product [Cuscuta campestris]